jgi:hypothetical protein
MHLGVHHTFQRGDNEYPHWHWSHWRSSLHAILVVVLRRPGSNIIGEGFVAETAAK